MGVTKKEKTVQDELEGRADTEATDAFNKVLKGWGTIMR